jgi:2-methylcitrate dehydratase PrpD
MTGITRQLAEFAANLKPKDIPEEVVARTRLLILDITGIMVRARHDAESTPSMMGAIQRLGLNQGRYLVLGDPTGYASSAAALINGTLAHSLDFDDTHAAASLHSSAPIFPAALTAAEMTSASGQDLIAACVAGYEVQVRLALALNPSDHYDRGFHPTATCGVFGAAAAAGRLLGLDAEGIQSAFGIALSQSAGSMQFLADGAWTKRSHVGQAASNGLLCATFAAEGFRGPAEAFEGNWGFLRSYAPHAEPEKAVKALGEKWETLELAVKPYPSCRYTHAPMDGLVALRNEQALDPDAIESVEVGVSATGHKLIGEPQHLKTHPVSIVDGQFSMPFCAAVVLRHGNLLWDDYPVQLKDQETLALCRKVNTVVDERAEATFPDSMSGVVTVKTGQGSFETFVGLPKGEPGNFMSEDEFRAKFSGLCEPYLEENRLEQLADALLQLDGAANVTEVFSLSRPQAG